MSWSPGVRRAVETARAVDRTLTRRTDHRAILVDARTPMNYAMVAPIHAAMRTDRRVRFYFTSSDAPSRVAEIYRDAGAGARLIAPGRAAWIRFDAYVTADLLWATLPRGTRRVQVFHGVSGKFSHDYDRPTSSMRHWDRLFFVNRRRLLNFIRAGAVDPHADALRLIGMPKVDCLVDGSLQRDAILASLGLDPGRPTILYAPTWSAVSSLNLLGIDLIERLLERSWNLIVKLHDRSCDPRPFYSGGIDWPGRLAALFRGRAAVLANRADLCPYLAAADAMITDHSSAGFEYLLLDRPLVRIHVPELLRASNANPNNVALLAEAAASVDGPAEAVAAVEHGLADPGERSASRRAVAQGLFYRPGTATRRATEELYRVIELDPIGRPLASSGGRPLTLVHDRAAHQWHEPSGASPTRLKPRTTGDPRTTEDPRDTGEPRVTAESRATADPGVTAEPRATGVSRP